MNHASATPPTPPRFKLITGTATDGQPIAVLRDYDTRTEYPFLMRASATSASAMLETSHPLAAYLIGKPFELDAFNRILSTLEDL